MLFVSMLRGWYSLCLILLCVLPHSSLSCIVYTWFSTGLNAFLLSFMTELLFSLSSFFFLWSRSPLSSVPSCILSWLQCSSMKWSSRWSLHLNDGPANCTAPRRRYHVSWCSMRSTTHSLPFTRAGRERGRSGGFGRWGLGGLLEGVWGSRLTKTNSCASVVTVPGENKTFGF